MTHLLVHVQSICAQITALLPFEANCALDTRVGHQEFSWMESRVLINGVAHKVHFQVMISSCSPIQPAIKYDLIFGIKNQPCHPSLTLPVICDTELPQSSPAMKVSVHSHRICNSLLLIHIHACSLLMTPSQKHLRGELRSELCCISWSSECTSPKKR